MKLRAITTVAASWERTNYGVNVGISMSYQIILRPEMTKLKLPAIVTEAPRGGGRAPRLDDSPDHQVRHGIGI